MAELTELMKTVMPIIVEHEGSTSYIYLDHLGNVTYGVGHNIGKITDPDTLRKMKAMVLYRDGEKATSNVALTDLEEERFYYQLKGFFEKNKKLKEGSTIPEINYPYVYYQNQYKIKVSETAAKEAFQRDVKVAIDDARYYFKNFDQLPLSARAALTELSFALGANKLPQYKELKQLVQSCDLKAAANEIGVRGWSGKRNADVKALLSKNLAVPLPNSCPPPKPKIPSTKFLKK